MPFYENLKFDTTGLHIHLINVSIWNVYKLKEEKEKTQLIPSL